MTYRSLSTWRFAGATVKTTWLLLSTYAAVSYVEERGAWACGSPFGEQVVFFPVGGEVDVPTNAKLLAAGRGESPALWLSKLSGAEGDASVGVSAADAGESDTIPVEVECLPGGAYTMCFGSAALEPNTRYAWGIGVPAPALGQEFTTGSGEREPADLPNVDIEVGSVRRSVGEGDCAVSHAATLRATFAASPETWVLVSGNSNDIPLVVVPGSEQVAWETADPEECFGVLQVNWSGEVTAVGGELCIAPPTPDAGAADAASEHTAVVSDAAASSAAVALEAGSADAAPSVDSSFVATATPDAADFSPEQADGGRVVAPSPQGGCDCRIGARPSAGGQRWAGLAFAGLSCAWLGRRRRAVSQRKV